MENGVTRFAFLCFDSFSTGQSLNFTASTGDIFRMILQGFAQLILTVIHANTAQARPVSVNYAVLSNQFATAVQNVLTGMDPKEALDEAVTQYNFQTDTE